MGLLFRYEHDNIQDIRAAHKARTRKPKPQFENQSVRQAWPEDRKQRLRELWAAKHSVRQIAVMMGTTPGSIAGQISHLGLPLRGRQFVRWTAAKRKLFREMRERGETVAAIRDALGLPNVATVHTNAHRFGFKKGVV